MPRTPENIVRHELIGLPVSIVESDDETQQGLAGRVVDETQQTLKIATDDDEKTLPKQGTVFRFELEDDTVDVNGDLLVGRPEERILKKFPRKWEYTG